MNKLILSGATRGQLAEVLVTLCVPREVHVYYFGCYAHAGHYLHERCGGVTSHVSFREVHAIEVSMGSIDGALCFNSGTPPYGRDETEGRAFLTQRGDWTSLAFWDRSIDKRPGANSAFLARGRWTFSQLYQLARDQWPQVWARFPFKVHEVERENGGAP